MIHGYAVQTPFSTALEGKNEGAEHKSYFNDFSHKFKEALEDLKAGFTAKIFEVMGNLQIEDDMLRKIVLQTQQIQTDSCELKEQLEWVYIEASVQIDFEKFFLYMDAIITFPYKNKIRIINIFFTFAHDHLRHEFCGYCFNFVQRGCL